MLGTEAGVSGDVGQVGAVFASVVHGNFYQARRRRSFVAMRVKTSPDERVGSGMIIEVRVEIHEHGCVRRMQVQDSAYAIQGAYRASHTLMRVPRDDIAEGN